MQGSHTDLDYFSANKSLHLLRNPDVCVCTVTQSVELSLAPSVHSTFPTECHRELGSTVDLRGLLLAPTEEFTVSTDQFPARQGNKKIENIYFWIVLYSNSYNYRSGYSSRSIIRASFIVWYSEWDLLVHHVSPHVHCTLYSTKPKLICWHGSVSWPLYKSHTNWNSLTLSKES